MIGVSMEDENRMWDFVVVGGGIAGLAIAEMLQRSGASVLLLEKNKTLCGGASSEQQGWFHTGALYAALPQNSFFRALVGNLDDLVDYYSGFTNMNLRIDKHISTTEGEGWFSNRTNFYAYTNWKGVDWRWKIPWAIALNRARRRMSWFEYLDSSRSLSRQMGIGAKPTRYVVHGSSLKVNLENVAFVLKSRDRVMNTKLIAEDLLKSFLASGGVVQTQTSVLSVEEGNVISTSAGKNGRATCNARHIILATGKGTDEFDTNVRVVASPLLVVFPALSDMNFVKMSPRMDDTINHIFHRFDDLQYSLIGNAVYYDLANYPADFADHARAQMLELTKKMFRGLDDRPNDLYFGYKTEVTTSSSLRNYLYHIIERPNYTLALPGKFSLCFSLAVNVCRHFGIEPIERVKMAEGATVSRLVEEPLHYTIAKKLSLR